MTPGEIASRLREILFHRANGTPEPDHEMAAAIFFDNAWSNFEDLVALLRQIERDHDEPC